MNLPFHVEITDWNEAQRTSAKVTLGHYFAFVMDGSVLKRSGRQGRLFGYQNTAGAAVLPLLDKPISLRGVTVSPRPPKEILPVGCLVADRDLYRAEQDTVHLFAMSPQRPRDLALRVTEQGAPFCIRPLDFSDGGVAIETLSMLLPGSYQAQLVRGDQPVGQTLRFTVAEYTLAPLSARLISHKLRRLKNELSFELFVESYQLPFDRKLYVSLMHPGGRLSRALLDPEGNGRYQGRFQLLGEGPFSLLLEAYDDSARTAQVALPGTRSFERSLTLVSELGQEVFLSLMPEAGAISVRGAHLTKGDHISTPITSSEVVTSRPELTAHTDLVGLELLIADLGSGRFETQKVGDIKRGEKVQVKTAGPMSTVFCGCLIDGHPFEGYTSVLSKPRFSLAVEAPKVLRPKEELALKLKVDGPDEVSVLLSVRDMRLMQTDTPQVALAASMKKGLSSLLDVYASDVAFVPLRDAIGLASDGFGRRGPPPPSVLRETQNSGRGLEFDEPTRVSAIPRLGDDPAGRTARDTICDEPASLPSRRDEMIAEPMIEAPHQRLARSLRPRPSAERYLDDDTNEIEGSAFEDVADDFDALGFSDEVEVTGEIDIGPALSIERSSSSPGHGPRVPSLDLGDTPNPRGEFQRPKSPQPPEPPSPPDEREPSGPGQPHPQVRSVFPEVLFYGVVPIDPEAGEAVIPIPLGDALTTYSVEAFAFSGNDWLEERSSFVVDQPVRVDLDVPPAVHAEDKVYGVLRAFASGGHMRVTLTRDGVPEPLLTRSGKGVTELVEGPAELLFRVRPGDYLAQVEDLTTGEVDSLEAFVSVPGRFKSYVRQVVLLQPSQKINLEETDAIALRVLPSLDAPLQQLTEATAGYGHLCCEQTAAKILAAVVMYLSARGPVEKAVAQEIIESGIARERRMWMAGRGFLMYPDVRNVSEHYSRLTVQYLWSVSHLLALPDLDARFRASLREALDMADDAAVVHRLSRVPVRINSMDDAYAVATSGNGRRHGEALAFVLDRLDIGRGTLTGSGSDPVTMRREYAYAAATLIALGRMEPALPLANRVLRAFNDAGRLYSTVDSVAAIAMLLQLQRVGLVSGDGQVTVAGRLMSSREAFALTETIEEVQAHESVAAVEVTRIVEEDWSSYDSDMRVTVGFRSSTGAKINQFRMGDRADLVVQLDAYKFGDLLHVALPASLAWIHGGGRVKRFTIDFEGKTELRVPLVVTSPIQGREHFAICVRNMFEEARSTSPGLLSVVGAARPLE